MQEARLPVTEQEARSLVNRMMKLWVDWEPTTELTRLWVDVLAPYERDVAWKALQLAYGHAHWKVPKPSNFQKEINALVPVRDEGVHAKEALLVTMSPLFILEVELKGRRKTRKTIPPQKPEYETDDKGCRRRKPMRYTFCELRYFTWAFPGALPAEEIMLQRARGFLTLTEYIYGEGWIIADARQPAVGASEYVLQLSWRLAPKMKPVQVKEDPIPF